MKPSSIITVLCLTLAAILVVFAWACASGCASNKGGSGPTIVADRYVDELYAAYYSSYDKLMAVGAPARHYNGRIKVTFKACHTPGRLGYGDGKNGRYALTIGEITEMCLSPDWSFQPAVAEAELGHYLLFRDESLDYPWLRAAGMLPPE